MSVKGPGRPPGTSWGQDCSVSAPGERFSLSPHGKRSDRPRVTPTPDWHERNRRGRLAPSRRTGLLAGSYAIRATPPPAKPPPALGQGGWRACYINISMRQIAGALVCLLPPRWQPHKDASDKTKRQPRPAKPPGARSCPCPCSGPRTPRPAADNTVIVLL